MQRITGDGTSKVIVDLHPDLPKYRGIMTPRGLVSMEANTGFEEIERPQAPR